LTLRRLGCCNRRTSPVSRLRWIPWLRRLPAWLPGKLRLARLLVRPERFAGELSITLDDGLVLRVPSLMEPVAFHLMVSGVYEPLVARFLSGRIHPGSVFVDVGANVGCFTLRSSRRAGPEGRVLAVEASPRVFPYLAHNLMINGCRNVYPVQAAAHEHDRRLVDFYEAPSEKFGMGSLAPQFHAGPATVVTRTLDSLVQEYRLPRVDVMKLDVEGFEGAALLGAASVLREFRPPVVFEFCDWAERRVSGIDPGHAQRVLLELGYDLWEIGAFLRGYPPLPVVRTEGCWTLVARHRSRSG
jgi:FkbM family methyltransferase